MSFGMCLRWGIRKFQFKHKHIITKLKKYIYQIWFCSYFPSLLSNSDNRWTHTLLPACASFDICANGIIVRKLLQHAYREYDGRYLDKIQESMW